jgi:hypothetical protein
VSPSTTSNLNKFPSGAPRKAIHASDFHPPPSPCANEQNRLSLTDFPRYTRCSTPNPTSESHGRTAPMCNHKGLGANSHQPGALSFRCPAPLCGTVASGFIADVLLSIHREKVIWNQFSRGALRSEEFKKGRVADHVDPDLSWYAVPVPPSSRFLSTFAPARGRVWITNSNYFDDVHPE